MSEVCRICAGLEPPRTHYCKQYRLMVTPDFDRYSSGRWAIVFPVYVGLLIAVSMFLHYYLD